MFKEDVTWFFCVSFIVLQIFPGFAASRSERDNVRYVSDVLVINIKNRLEKPYEVVATVQSDDPVQIIEESGNYLKIETADGKQGWIAKHYLKSEMPKALLIKQLKQEVTDLKDQLSSKHIATSETVGGEKSPDNSLCKELQQKLSDAEKHIAQLQDDLYAQQHRSPEPSTSPSELMINEVLIATDQLEQNPENYALLISEYEKQGKLISELQKTLSKKDDQTRFLWFGAGAAVFAIGLLVGKTGNRKKNKLMY
ncbi:SH3 domain-containing protein [Candidatus Roizmanbacteria bacterium]|nr:SH3 domain-containing protein [Candidatus Roizmanbacteria bacterium]